MARTTACAPMVLPSSNRTTRFEPCTSSADESRVSEQLGAELARLPAGPVGELAAGDAVGEAEVVLDPAALPGLPAGRLALDEHRPQPLGGAVDGGAEPGRARRRPR